MADVEHDEIKREEEQHNDAPPEEVGHDEVRPILAAPLRTIPHFQPFTAL